MKYRYQFLFVGMWADSTGFQIDAFIQVLDTGMVPDTPICFQKWCMTLMHPDA